VGVVPAHTICSTACHCPSGHSLPLTVDRYAVVPKLSDHLKSVLQLLPSYRTRLKANIAKYESPSVLQRK